MSQIRPEKEKLEEYESEISVYKNYTEKLISLRNNKIALRPPSFFSFGICFFVIFLISFILGGGFWSSIPLSLLASFYVSIFSFESDFLANLFSLGKFNELKKRIKEVEGLQKDSYSRLEPFERAIRDYCQTQLKEFFENNLYKKRSGSEQFEESLSEFSSMIQELSVLNSNFITTRIFLGEYKNYLIKRTINHNLQASKKLDKFASVRSFVRDVSKAQERKRKEVVAPEKFYRTARKIDNWDEINKKRRTTGLKGEEIVLVIEQEFFESIGRKDLAEKVRHVSVEDGDGLGYDVLSFFENGKEKYIEVKSTTALLESPFYLSRNELGFLRDHNESSFIYRILVSNNIPQVRIYSSPEILEKLEKNEIIPVQYLVRGS